MKAIFYRSKKKKKFMVCVSNPRVIVKKNGSKWVRSGVIQFAISDESCKDGVTFELSVEDALYLAFLIKKWIRDDDAVHLMLDELSAIERKPRKDDPSVH